MRRGSAAALGFAIVVLTMPSVPAMMTSAPASVGFLQSVGEDALDLPTGAPLPGEVPADPFLDKIPSVDPTDNHDEDMPDLSSYAATVEVQRRSAEGTAFATLGRTTQELYGYLDSLAPSSGSPADRPFDCGAPPVDDTRLVEGDTGRWLDCLGVDPFPSAGGGSKATLGPPGILSGVAQGGSAAPGLGSQVEPVSPPRSEQDTTTEEPRTARREPTGPLGSAATFVTPEAGLPVMIGIVLAALGIVAAILFTRLSRHQELDNELRARIFAKVSAQPGSTAASIARDFSIHLTTATYHLRRMQSRGLVASSRQNRITYWAKAGFRIDPTLAHATRTPLANSLARLVADRPGKTAGDLAREAGVTADAARYHLHNLAAARLVRKETQPGVRPRWYPAEGAQIRSPTSP